MSNVRILFFGDSYTWGAWDSEGGYVDRLKKIANKRTIKMLGAEKVQLFNLGIGGDTSRAILERMNHEIESRISPKWQMKLLFTFGANDVRIKGDKAEIPINEFRDNTQKIIDNAKKYTNEIIFFGSPPINVPIVKFSDSIYTDDDIKKYDKAMKEVAEQNGIRYVNVRGKVEGRKDDGLYAFDDIHLNDKGHEFMAKTIEESGFLNPSEDKSD